MAGKQLKFRGRAKIFPLIFLLLGAVFLSLDILMFAFFGTLEGAFAALFVILYFAVISFIYITFKPSLIEDLIAFATDYNDNQKVLMTELDVPYSILSEDGKILWCNNSFEKVTSVSLSEHKSIFSLFEGISENSIPNADDEDVEQTVSVDTSTYRLKLRRLPLSGMVREGAVFGESYKDTALIALYLYDETALNIAIKEIDDQSMVAALIYLDNYDEVMETLDEVKRSMLSALIDRKVSRYISSFNGVSKKLEKDKYFAVVSKQSVIAMTEARFDILEDVKTVSMGNEMSVTLSIGVGYGGLTYAQNYEFARNSIGLALGRGGDQAVVKTAQNVSYFGGKSQQVEKTTKVKARVKAHAFEEIANASDTVIVMGHRMGDVDSFGACVGVHRIASTLNRKCYIVLDQVTTSTEPLVELFKSSVDYEEGTIVTSSQAVELVSDSTAVVVVDVNKPSITECPELLHKSKTVVVFDHHRAGKEVIDNASLSYVEPYASSASEMITEIMQYIEEPVKLTQTEALLLYSGIMIDTDNFVQKTGVRTFEAAAYLRRNGAEVTTVRKLFRENVDEYKAKADAVSQAEIYRGIFAISVCQGEGIASPTIVGAQAANDLLNIKKVKASFVCTEYQGMVYISARSIDEVNVQVIMEKLGGGGHLNMAGAQLETALVEEGIASVKRTIDDMIESGELEI